MKRRNLTAEELGRQRAAQAVRRFNLMVPTLQRYARRITGNPKLTLKAGPQSQTDGNVIEIQPPMELATRRTHQRAVCGEREYGLAVCPACRSNEIVMAHVRHEIGHILHGSFDPVNSNEVLMTFKFSVLKDTKFQKRFVEGFQQIECTCTNAKSTCQYSLLTHVSMAQHPYLTSIMLMMEDIRCDTRRLDADPDEAEVFFAMCQQLLELGVEREDGTTFQYVDASREQQAVLAFLFASSGHTNLDLYFDPEIVRLNEHPTAVSLMRRAKIAPDTEASFAFGMQLLEFYMEHDLMKVDDDVDSEELQQLLEDLMEMMSQVLGHGQELEQPSAGEKPEPGQAGEKKGEGKPTKKGGWGGSQDSDEPVTSGLRPDDIKDIMTSMNWLDHVPVHVKGPVVRYGDTISEGRAIDPSHLDYPYFPELKEFKPEERYVAPALNAARLAFGVNSRIDRHRNQRSGRVSAGMLARRVPFGDDRLFSKKIVPDNRSYHVVIGMDASGSTGGETLFEEKQAVFAMADVCNRLGIGFEIWAHTTEGGYSAGSSPALYGIKRHNERWDEAHKQNLRGLLSTGGNLDGHTLQFYRKRAEASRATDKILMYYTDGAMPAMNAAEELEVLQSEIKYCNSHGITLMAVGMGVDSPKEHGFDTFCIDGPEDYRGVVDHLGKRLMR